MNKIDNFEMFGFLYMYIEQFIMLYSVVPIEKKKIQIRTLTSKI